MLYIAFHMPAAIEKWYHNWFNSPYYHILYNDRDQEEAERFIDNLFAFLAPDSSARILDGACGRGRHVIYINKKGYDVTGLDLSKENIEFASSFENRRMRFFQHDIRNLFYINYYDIVLNLFTSFGYFEKEHDNFLALSNFAKSLRPGGYFVLDFLNAEKVRENMVVREIVEKEGITFYINRKLEAGYFVKEIRFSHREKQFAFKERVKAFAFRDLEQHLGKAGFLMKHVFGDYDLTEFRQEKSDRLILICAKND